MSDVKLLNLSLRNFKGMNYSCSPDGDSLNFYGENKTGKTTIADSFFFLITGKNAKGQAKFDIKTNRKDGKPETQVEHEVTGKFSVDGVPVELKCIFHEVWRRKRGSVEQEMTGHTTNYFIDGVSVSESVYKTRVAEMMGNEQVFALVSNPTYFTDLAALKWEQARGLIMKYFSKLTDDEVFEAADLGELREILTAKRRDVETHKDVVTAEQKKINEQISAVPIRIDEVRRGLPDVTGLDSVKIGIELSRLETTINERKLTLQGVETGGALAALTRRLSVVNDDLQRVETFHRTETMKTVNKLDEEISEVERMVRDDKSRLSSLECEIQRKKGHIFQIEKELETAREKWSAVDAQAFQDSTEEFCPTCRQPLPSESILEAQEKAKAAFNNKKAEELAQITGNGTRLAGDKKKLEAEIETLRTESETISATFAEKGAKLETLTADRDALKKTAEDYTALKGHTELVMKKSDIEAEIQKEREGHKQETEAVKEEITFFQGLLNAAKADADKFTRRQDGEKRIEVLKAEEKKLAAEYERLEKEKFLCEKFIQEKARMMSDEINHHFRLARFVLFEEQINGGIKPTCLITEGGNIAGRGLNTGTMINVGLDICQAFSRALGLRTPIIIDNAESVTSWIETDQQILRFNASYQDKTLRVEREKVGE